MNPIFRETFNLQIQAELFQKTHLYFSVKTCSDSGKEKEIAFAFINLATKEGTVRASPFAELLLLLLLLTNVR
jgi:hypothetical protein